MKESKRFKNMRDHRVSVRSRIKESEKHYTQYQKGLDQFGKKYQKLSAVEKQADQKDEC